MDIREALKKYTKIREGDIPDVVGVFLLMEVERLSEEVQKTLDDSQKARAEIRETLNGIAQNA